MVARKRAIETKFGVVFKVLLSVLAASND